MRSGIDRDMDPCRAGIARVPRRGHITVAVAAAALLWTPPALALDPLLYDAVAMAAVALHLDSQAPALIIAVVDGAETIIGALGETAPGSGIAPDESSILRLGSISKVFTADILASMVVDGTVGLGDPLSRYAPAGVVLPAGEGRPITLLDLATHSAGLPRDLPPPPDIMAEDDPEALVEADPGLSSTPDARLSAAAYWDWLATAERPARPGEAAAYSNFGFGLLGEALAAAGGKPYADLLAERVAAPLGLEDTVTRLSDGQRARLLVGYDLLGVEDEARDGPTVTDASGAVYSTAADMARWMRWHLDRSEPEGLAARAIAHAMYLPYDGLRRAVGVGAPTFAGMALGWEVMPAGAGTPHLLAKSGGIGGFMTYVVLAPNHGVGIFVAVTRLNFAMFGRIQEGVHRLAAELTGPGG